MSVLLEAPFPLTNTTTALNDFMLYDVMSLTISEALAPVFECFCTPFSMPLRFIRFKIESPISNVFFFDKLAEEGVEFLFM